MDPSSHRAKPPLLRQIRFRVALVLILGFTAFEVLVVWQGRHETLKVQADASRTEAVAVSDAVAGAFATAYTAQLPPAQMQAALDRLRLFNPTVRSLSIYGVRNGTPVRLASTDRSPAPSPIQPHAILPLTTGQSSYRERQEDGRHLAELNVPLRDRGGRRVAALGLYVDMTAAHEAIGATDRRMATVGIGGALALLLFCMLLLNRMMFAPLHRVRSTVRSLAAGDLGSRVSMDRSDELGVLAADIDHMADELEEAYGRVERLALTDSLTGLANHRAFEERLEEELERARREDYPVAVVALDIDHFKMVNDALGHAAGDDALMYAADAIRGTLRPFDLCGRVGGDEFMVILSGADSLGAARAVARLREAIGSRPFGPTSHRLSLSAGIAMYPEHASTRKELTRLADRALYRSKQDGRNRQSLYSPHDTAPLPAVDGQCPDPGSPNLPPHSARASASTASRSTC